MQIVIDIPEIEYEHITNREKFFSLERSKREWLLNKTLNRLSNGIPLPKGHGRLIDADDFLTLFRDGTEGYDCATYTRYDIGEILEKDAPTVIDADKERD